MVVVAGLRDSPRQWRSLGDRVVRFDRVATAQARQLGFDVELSGAALRGECDGPSAEKIVARI
jgi:hypothetical protein